MNKLKRILKWIFILLLILNIAIVATGNTHLYKGIANTYLKGRMGPSISEYKIFPYREIKATAPVEWPLHQLYNKKELSQPIVDKYQSVETVAYVVIKNDSVLYESYWDVGGKESLTNSFSMAKTFVSVLTGIAITEGKIKSVDEPIGNYIPAYKEGKNAKITIKHLLTMSSGINFDEDYVSPFAYPAKAYYGSDIRALTMQYEAAEEPGKIFNYLSGNTEILGFVLEQATGKNISEYASEKLWNKIGARHNAYWSLDHDNGVEKAYCCFNSNALDFAKIGQLYMHHGTVNGQQIIDSNYVSESMLPANLLDMNGNKNTCYGYSWWMMDYKGMHITYARGILGQYVILIPDKNAIIVRLGGKRSKEKIGDHPKDVFMYIDEGLKML